MSLREYLFILLIGTCIASIGWCMVLMSVNPFATGALGFLAFYAMFFLMIMGFVATLGTVVRSRALVDASESHILRALVRSLRQGAFFAAILCVAFIALAAGWFSPFFFLGGFFGIAFLEFCFLLWEERHIARAFGRG